ncbi:response regulator [Gelidibacter mesophilus]|uniref:response regulator n=1 Tax=Gelidibacter mesophilus TaxID=169050 RepID=UPI000410A461|nr:response regulator [Gelidibacter mesophilus]
MEKTKLHLLLADDDIDDCDFFKDAMDEIASACQLTTLNNGVELMTFLSTAASKYPNLIFLDLNMPKKSGMECIAEIKASKTFSHIPIIIYSTSLDHTVVNDLYDMGAHHYIQKPAEFASIKSVIKQVIALFGNALVQPRSRDNFIIQPEG